MFLLFRGDGSTFVGESLKYKDIDDGFVKKVANESKRFVDFIFSLNDKFSFKNNFGIDDEAVDIARREAYLDLENHARSGLDLKKKENGTSDNDPIEETLFFYPLVGMLYSLSHK